MVKKITWLPVAVIGGLIFFLTKKARAEGIIAKPEPYPETPIIKGPEILPPIPEIPSIPAIPPTEPAEEMITEIIENIYYTREDGFKERCRELGITLVDAYCRPMYRMANSPLYCTVEGTFDQIKYLKATTDWSRPTALYLQIPKPPEGNIMPIMLW